MLNYFLAGYNPNFFSVLGTINLVIVTIIGIFYWNQIVYLIGSLFIKKKKYKDAKKNHKYAILISARNEEEVIGQLIDSIMNQNYPKDLLKVFVVADNCTDKTAIIARNHGAHVFERFDTVKKGKSYALDYVYHKIKDEGLDEGFEAYFIFDADNVLSPNYIMEMNKVYDAGYKASTSYRAPKNFADSWVSGTSSYMYLRECREVHRVRMAFKSGTYVSGTGFFVAASILDENGGWIHHTLTEDIEFSTDICIKGGKIVFCEDAVFFDEQPIKLRDSLRQRLRWCKGTHQIAFHYEGRLFKSFFKHFSFTKWDMIGHVTPLPVISLIWVFLYAIIGMSYSAIATGSLQAFNDCCLNDVLNFFLFPYIAALINGMVICFQTFKLVKAPWYKKLFYGFMFPIFMLFYLPLSFKALFVKAEWKPVKHSCKADYQAIEKTFDAQANNL